MARSVEFFFDCVSSASYLAWTQMPALADHTGAEIVYRPMFLPGLFKDTGNASPLSVPAKGRYLASDLARFARRYEVPFRFNDRFPLNSIAMMRALTAWKGKQQFPALGDAFMDAMWVSNRDVTNPGVLAEIAGECDIDPEDFERAISDPAVKQALIDTTAEARERGAFGAPTFFVGDQMFWGQDRIDFVREALAEAA